MRSARRGARLRIACKSMRASEVIDVCDDEDEPSPLTNNDLRELHAARVARRGPPPTEPTPPATSSSSSGKNNKRPRDHPLNHIWLSGVGDKYHGSVVDARGLSLPRKSTDYTEVACYSDEADFEAAGQNPKVFTLQPGMGKLKDKPAKSDQESERNIKHLKKSAKKIFKARQRDEDVWVHCQAGINRGPAGLIAYLMLHTEVESLHEAHKLINSVRRKAHTTYTNSPNTFSTELERIAHEAGKGV